MQSGKRCWIGLIIAIGAMAIVLSSVWSPPLAATQYPREKRRKPTPRTKRQPRTTPVPRRQPPPTTERQPRPNESQQQPPKTSVSPQTVTIELVDIPAGEFTMGSENGNTNEKPVHRVRINYAFKMGKYEVTQAQWQEVMGSNPSYFKFCGGNCPLENVSWNDVQQFLQRLNARKDLYTYRLPTEAEWEYACRAGTTTEFAFGETITPDIVNYDGNYPYGNSPNGINREKPVAVGSLGRANRWGLSDMHGNVWEWCEDVYHDNYIGAPTDGSAWLTPRSDGKNYRLLRGGSLGSYARYCRSAGRNRVEAGNHGNQFGFRVVAVLRTTPSVVASPPTTAQPKEPNPPPKTNPTDTNPAPAPRDAEKKREPAEVQIEMVRIPVEKFLMGSPPNEQGREDERPQREVTITNSFYMSKYEVTQAEWRAVSALPKVSIDLPSNPSKFRGDNLPVEQVSWEDAVEFCERLSRATRKNYRLPTEAEWEYACRAGATEMYAGNLDAMAWYIANSGNTTHPVGQKQPNRFGLYDMYGNVFEWCRDLYDENYYSWGPKVDPLGPATGLNRVGRGGAWSSDAAVLRAAFRGKDVPSFRSDFLGFRVVRTSN